MLRRTGAATLVVAAIALGVAPPAHAAPPSFLSRIECGSSGGAGCAVLLRWALENGGRPGEGTHGTGSAPESGGTAPSDGVDWDAVDWDAVDWDAVDWDAIDWDAVDYDGTGENDTPVDPVSLIMESMDSFELPPPTIGTSPGVGAHVLVHTPVWLWVEQEDWNPATATADVPGLTLELTASPAWTRWTLGDGTQLVCAGPGTPFDPKTHDPAAESPDCGHVYTRSSGTEPGGVFSVSAEITWDIGWNFSDGQNGELDPVATSSGVPLAVKESQSLVTGVGQG